MNNTKFLGKKKFRNTNENKENNKFDKVQNLYTKARSLYEDKVIPINIVIYLFVKK